MVPVSWTGRNGGFHYGTGGKQMARIKGSVAGRVATRNVGVERATKLGG